MNRMGIRIADHTASLAILLVLASTFCFATMDAISKLLASDYSIAQILWMRYIFFAVFAFTIVRGHCRAAILCRKPWLQALRAMLLVAENGVFILAFQYLPLADVHAIAATAPLMVVVLSGFLLSEPVGNRRRLAVGVGFLGVLLIIRPGFQTLDWSVAIPLCGALMWAIYQILVRLCNRADNSDTTLLWTAIIGLALTSAVGPLSWKPPDTVDWLLLVFLALSGSLGHYALIMALKFAEASTIQPYNYTLLVFAALWGIVLFNDVPDVATVAGAAIIVASGLYVWYREFKMSEMQL
ncbi:MAG: DMT family transporter [Hyphomicrobiaceae bacterium]